MNPLEFVTIDWNQHSIDIEYQWAGGNDLSQPLMVFLHEGLGSCAMWKDFPERLCCEIKCRGLVYSRPGYGQSSMRAENDHLRTDFLHRQACEVLPALLNVLQVDAGDRPIWLFGHSDGGSIALLYAAKFNQQVAGLIVVSPHILVEQISIDSIRLAREAYLQGDLKAKLGRYHDDPDSAFWGWNDIWLHHDFRNWSIEDEIKSIQCPLLAVQGLADTYGTLEQIHGIKRRLPQAQLLELADCGHSPHRDQSNGLIAAVKRFMG